MRVRLALIIVLAFGVCGAPARAEDPVAVRRAVEDALAGDGFQRALPRGDEGAPAERADEYDRTGGGSGGGSTGVVSPAAAGFLAQIFAWGLMVAAAGIVLYFLIRLVLGARVGRDERHVALLSASPDAPVPRGPLPTLADAVALANAGNCDEATHLLLLAALGRILGEAPADALTSREILGQMPGETDRRRALGHLVRAVESSRFAGRPLARADFDGCVDSYELLRGGEGAAA